jgi:hypothetical protein
VIYNYHKIRSNPEISHVTPYLPTVETNDNETENNRNNNIPKGKQIAVFIPKKKNEERLSKFQQLIASTTSHMQTIKCPQINVY